MGHPHPLKRVPVYDGHRVLHLVTVWLMLFVVLPPRAVSQTAGCNSSTQGTEFWVSFLSNLSYYTIPTNSMKLVATSSAPSVIQVVNHLNNWDTTVLCGAHASVEIPIHYTNGFALETDSIMNMALHVVSDHAISLYASNAFTGSSDIATILPTGALGTEYITQTYTYDDVAHPQQEFAIAATADSTVVTLHGFPNSDTNTTVTLMRGQAIRYKRVNLSGIRITSNGIPFALFQGHRCANVGDCGACDHLFEQALPVKLWGKNFLLVSSAERQSGDEVLITSSEDNCILTIDDSVTATLNSGETYRYALPYDEAHMLAASKPVYTCIYLMGIDCGNDNGDPASVTVPPIEQCIKAVTFQAISSLLINLHYANIVTRTVDLPYMMLDSVYIGDEFTSLPGGYSYLRKTVSPGIHILENSHGGFLAHFYGLGQAECYAYIAGMATHNLNYSLFLDSVNVRTHTDLFDYCPGDTAHFQVMFDADSVSVVWQVDSQWVATNDGHLVYHTDSTGWHTVDAIINTCDTSSVTVFVYPKQIDTVAFVRCEREGFALGDSVYRASCDVLRPYTDGFGCPADSIYRLTIIPTAVTPEEDSLCFNASYTWHGMELDSAGIFHDSLLSIVTGCDSIIELSLYPIPRPNTGITPVADCDERHYSLTALTVGNTPFRWTSTPHDAHLDGHEEDTVVHVNPSSRTTYSLDFDYRCPYSDTLTLNPMMWPQAYFVVFPDEMGLDIPYIDAYDRSRNATERQWFVNDQFQLGADRHLHYDADADIDSLLVTLVVSNRHGNCVDTMRRIVPFIHNAVWAPNVFLPTMDRNDIVRVVLREGTIEDLYIYNRQGALISHSQGPEAQWDGTHNGTPCPQGTYTWHLRYHEDRHPALIHTKTGTITLIR